MLYRSEYWTLRQVGEIKILRLTVGVTILDKVRNEYLRTSRRTLKPGTSERDNNIIRLTIIRTLQIKDDFRILDKKNVNIYFLI